jgi:hypothetical protein
MRILVFIPLIIFQFLFINPFGLDSIQSWGAGSQHVIFKKYNSEKSLPVLLIEEEVEDSEDPEKDSRIYTRQSNFSDNHFSLVLSLFQSFRSGLFSSVNPLNLRNLGIDLFQLNRNLRL